MHDHQYPIVLFVSSEQAGRCKYLSLCGICLHDDVCVHFLFQDSYCRCGGWCVLADGMLSLLVVVSQQTCLLFSLLSTKSYQASNLHCPCTSMQITL